MAKWETRGLDSRTELDRLEMSIVSSELLHQLARLIERRQDLREPTRAIGRMFFIG
jgi:hypothetical protein